MATSKPIRVFWSPLTGNFYATQAYKERPEMPGHFVMTGKKHDVTQDIAAIIVENDIVFKKAPKKRKARRK